MYESVPFGVSATKRKRLYYLKKIVENLWLENNTFKNFEDNKITIKL